MVRKQGNEIVRTPKAPSLLLEQHEKTIRKRLLRGILSGELAPYAHGAFFVITAPRVNGVNTNTGVVSEMEFRTKPQTVVIENEADFHWFIETVANDFATREANYIKDGYPWDITEVLDITFYLSPSPEHRQVKRRTRQFEHNRHPEIEDEDKVNEEKEVLNYANVNNTFRKKRKYQNPRTLVQRAEFNTRPRTSLNNTNAGNYFPLPSWTKQCGISNPPSDFLDMKFACRTSAIIWSLMDKNQRKHPKNSVIRKVMSSIDLPSDDIKYDRMYFKKFMELNPKYYIVALSFEGMNRYIEKHTVLANYSIFIHPPIDIEGKTPIYLLMVPYARPYYNDIFDYITRNFS
jgi:hypothetical protein